MAFKSTLDLYSSVILPRLAEGPKTIEQMDVPQYAVEHLRARGLIKPRSFRVESMAVQVWFLPEQLALIDGSLWAEPQGYVGPELCEDDWPPDAC